MKAMMEILLNERAERKKKEEGSSSKDAEVKKEEKGKGVGGDGDPPETKQTFSSLILLIMQVLVCLISNWM